MTALSRRPLVAGNWKMFKRVGEAVNFVNDLKNEGADQHRAEVVVAPPFTALHSVFAALSDSRIGLAAQNCHYENEGAFTGEVSPLQLRDVGCTYVIVGHSERRHIFGETNAQICKKVSALLSANLTPILCVGETLAQREAGHTNDIVLEQLNEGLASLDAATIARVVLAYEPVWAIGTGKNAKPSDAQEVHAAIRNRLEKLADPTTAERIRILYGGSVKPDNAKDLMSQPDIDGALVGGASLQASTFLPIILGAE